MNFGGGRRHDGRDAWVGGLAIVVAMLVSVAAVLGVLGWFVEFVTGGVE